MRDVGARRRKRAPGTHVAITRRIGEHHAKRISRRHASAVATRVRQRHERRQLRSGSLAGFSSGSVASVRVMAPGDWLKSIMGAFAARRRPGIGCRLSHPLLLAAACGDGRNASRLAKPAAASIVVGSVSRLGCMGE